MSPEEEKEGQGEDDRETGGHWTDTHPDRHMWSPGQLALARTQTQEEYEALYGRGDPPPAPTEASSPDSPTAGTGRWNPLYDPIPKRGEGDRRPDSERIPTPDLFKEVADRLGFEPPNIPPSPPRFPRGLDDPAPEIWHPAFDEGLEPSRRTGFAPTEGLEPRPIGPIDETESTRKYWKYRDPERHGRTADFIAYYHPWHVGGDEYWGIYFRKSHMADEVDRIENLFGWKNMRAIIEEQVFWHEMEHFEQELAATTIEDLLSEIIYPKWLPSRYRIPVELEIQGSNRSQSVYMIEEALATAREVEWAREQQNRLPADYADFIEWDSRSKPIGYRSFNLCLGDRARREARAAFLESVGSIAWPPAKPRLHGETADRQFGIRTSSWGVVPVTWVNH